MPYPNGERRFKMVCVGEQFATAWLQAFDPATRVVSVPYFPDLPEGYLVDRVVADPSNRTLNVIVWHSSFKIVPDGMELPRMSSRWSVLRLRPDERADGDFDVRPCGCGDPEYPSKGAGIPKAPSSLFGRTYAEAMEQYGRDLQARSEVLSRVLGVPAGGVMPEPALAPAGQIGSLFLQTKGTDELIAWNTTYRGIDVDALGYTEEPDRFVVVSVHPRDPSSVPAGGYGLVGGLVKKNTVLRVTVRGLEDIEPEIAAPVADPFAKDWADPPVLLDAPRTEHVTMNAEATSTELPAEESKPVKFREFL